MSEKDDPATERRRTTEVKASPPSASTAHSSGSSSNVEMPGGTKIDTRHAREVVEPLEEAEKKSGNPDKATKGE